MLNHESTRTSTSTSRARSGSRSRSTDRPRAWFATLASPVGELRLIATDAGLAGIVFPDSTGPAITPVPTRTNDDHPVLALAAVQLDEYFAGRRLEFTIELAPQGTPFQLRVWEQLATIPYGETRSYGQIATSIGKPTAMRAVGAANGKNPLPIIVPCHRVIGANGTLTGFGGGLPTKQWLLDHERRHSKSTRHAAASPGTGAPRIS